MPDRNPTNREKKLINFISLSAECNLLRAEGFYCSLVMSKLQFLIQRKEEKNRVLFFFFFIFWSSKSRIRIRIYWKCWIRTRIHSSAIKWEIWNNKICPERLCSYLCSLCKFSLIFPLVRWKDLRSRIVEHNIRIMAKYYTR